MKVSYLNAVGASYETDVLYLLLSILLAVRHSSAFSIDKLTDLHIALKKERVGDVSSHHFFLSNSE